MTPDMTPAPTGAVALITEIEMPAVARAASKRSRQAKVNSERGVGAGLLLLMVAALAGLFVWEREQVDVAGLVALIAFLGAVAARIYRLSERPDKIWSQSRVLAEDAKSLAWRYAVGGLPYGLDAPSVASAGAPSPALTAEADLQRRLDGFLEKARTQELHLPPPGGDEDQITASMQQLRQQPPEVRQGAYIEGRIGDQEVYYRERSSGFEQFASLWNAALFVVEGLGVLAALAKVLSLFHIDALGLAGTVVAAGMSWVQLHRYAALAESYSAMAHKLRGYRGVAMRSGAQWSEAQWASFVDEVETLLEKEHLEWSDLFNARFAPGRALGG